MMKVFAYRDTDFDVAAQYKVGMLLTSDRDLSFDMALQRPVHTTRFIIYADGDRQFYPKGSLFCVVGVQDYAEVHQIVLKAIEDGSFSELEEESERELKESEREDMDLKSSALKDLKVKMTSYIHAHSLLSRYTERMKHPVGMDESLHFLKTEQPRFSLLESTYVAGTKFHVTYEMWLYLEQKRRQVKLVRDEGNIYDANAVAIDLDEEDVLATEKRLGYVPKSCNSKIAALMDRGVDVRVRIEKISKSESKRIKIKVFRVNEVSDSATIEK